MGNLLFVVVLISLFSAEGKIEARGFEGGLPRARSIPGYRIG